MNNCIICARFSKQTLEQLQATTVVNFLPMRTESEEEIVDVVHSPILNVDDDDVVVIDRVRENCTKDISFKLCVCVN